MEMTIEFRGVELEIAFDYQPEEAQVNYYSDGSGYPGCSAEVDLISAFHKGTDMTELLEDFTEELEDLILSNI